MRTSFFDLFKIGIGPSSSHTVGPMRAAFDFVRTLKEAGLLPVVEHVKAELYGSLALTGIGHGTDRALLLGLSGHVPDQVDPNAVDSIIGKIQTEKRIPLGGESMIDFTPGSDLILHQLERLPFHSNGLAFTAILADGTEQRSIYYSVGGGAIVREGALTADQERTPVPYPFNTAEELLEQCDRHGLAIWRLMLENEKAWHPEEEVLAYIQRVWQTMQDCTDRGIRTSGILPGGLMVRRRAPMLFARLSASGHQDPLEALDWVNLYAIAVNEENAAGGRVVTAPTNGAAGIIPAVAHYYWRFLNGDERGIRRYFLAAAAIGVLYKENASISGAEVGCQGEVGVACSMAAAGLVSALGGANTQVEHAAEIGMEHNLGMTCDPVGGLVQIPCIERNAMASVKAINAARIAMRETEGHKVSLDQVIRTMYETGLDMQARYKETSLAGLAKNVAQC